jgi:hypothetical protein
MSWRKLVTLPKGWSMQQCAKCYMVFALPHLKGDSSQVLANARIAKELARHARENHPDPNVHLHQPASERRRPLTTD